jgi:hypothetical protein
LINVRTRIYYCGKKYKKDYMGEIKFSKYRRGELLLLSILLTGLVIKVYDSLKRGSQLEAARGSLRPALSAAGAKADFVIWEEH